MTNTILVAISIGTPVSAFLTGMYCGWRMGHSDAYQDGHKAGFGAAVAMYAEKANRVANVVAFPILRAVKR